MTMASVSPSCSDGRARAHSVHLTPVLPLIHSSLSPETLTFRIERIKNILALSTNSLRSSLKSHRSVTLGNFTNQPPTVSGHSLSSCLMPFKVMRQLAESCWFADSAFSLECVAKIQLDRVTSN